MNLELVLGTIVCGLFTVQTVGRLIEKFRNIDKEIDLPARITIKEYVMIFLCGMTAYQGISISSVTLLFLTMYLAFMAYTDYHTRKVYSVFSYLVFVVGVLFLFMTTDAVPENLVCMIFFVLIVLVGFVVKAYAFGDVEIYIAVYPYYAMYFFEMPEDILPLFMWFTGTLFLTVASCAASWVVCHVKGISVENQLKGRKAMAPLIAFAHVMLLCMARFV